MCWSEPRRSPRWLVWPAGTTKRLDSSGYHRGDPAALLPLPARILAAANAYHAMCELRPYRSAFTARAAAQELTAEVAAGRLDRDAVTAVLEAAGQHPEAPKREWPSGLTDREIDVLRLVVRVRTNKQMAGELFISEDTVKTHLRHVYEKVQSRRSRPLCDGARPGLAQENHPNG